MRFRRPEMIAGLAVPLLIIAALPGRAASVRAWEGTIQIPTYLLGPADPNPAFPLLHDHGPVYPYTMMDDLTSNREPKTYRAIYLENQYLKLTILPQLGGHLYSIYDKVDHREVLYRNNVVKYGLIGPRGAWVSGGVEFSFPFAHTDVSVSPVESLIQHGPDGSATAVVGAVDWVSNMHWEIALTLRPDTARVEQHVTLFNSTPSKHLYLFWANAAVRATDDMQYIYPMEETISDDPFATVQSWPVWKGVDESWYKNDPHAMAIFARASHRNFFGVYYHDSNYGVVHVANFRQDPGKKVWTWGTAPSGMIWAHILSDNDGPYNEIQAGRFYTQGYREFIDPRRVASWTEYWYPVRGLDGGFVEATNQMAVNALYQQAQGQPQVKVTVSPVADVSGATVTLKLGSKVLLEKQQVHLTPLAPVDFTAPVESLDKARKELSVEISYQGKPLLHWSAAEPVNGNPDFIPAAGTHIEKKAYNSQTPVQELYYHGVFVQKSGRLQEALKIYDQVLQRDPNYVPALLKLAWNAYDGADFQTAESLIARALKRDGENPAVNYAAGVIDRAFGKLTLAQDAFWNTIRYGGSLEPAFVELGEIAMQQGKYAEALRLLYRAQEYNPRDALMLADTAAAERLSGDAASAFKTVTVDALPQMPLLPYALAEQWLDTQSAGDQSAEQAAKSWTTVIGAEPQNYTAVAAWYHNLGAWKSSDAVLHAAINNLPPNQLSPMIYYYLASNARAEGDAAQAHADEQKALSLKCDEVFPNRLADAGVLAEAILHNPADAHAKYALGNFLFAHGRYAEASGLWFQALGEGFENAVLLRNLGVYAWRVKHNLPGAAGFYARAVHLSPGEYRLYPDLDDIYAQEGNTKARARLFASAPASVLAHDTVRSRYALLLIEQSKFDQAIALLMNHHFKPWEGGREIHTIYVMANVEKGKQALAAHHAAQAEQAFRAAMQYPENLGVGKPERPDDEEPLYWLGVALQTQGKKTEARAAWQRAANEGKEAENANAVYSALALQKLGEDAAARAILNRCIQPAKQSEARSYNYFVAGLAERYSSNPEVARDDFRHALQLDPQLWQARVALAGLNHAGS